MKTFYQQIKKLSDKELLKIAEQYRILTNMVPTKKADWQRYDMIVREIDRRK